MRNSRRGRAMLQVGFLCSSDRDHTSPNKHCFCSTKWPWSSLRPRGLLLHLGRSEWDTEGGSAGRGERASLAGSDTQTYFLAGSLWAGPSPVCVSVLEAQHSGSSREVKHLCLGLTLTSLHRLACRLASAMGTPSAASVPCTGRRV